MDSIRKQIDNALERPKIHKETVYGILRQIVDVIEPPAPTPAPVKAATPVKAPAPPAPPAPPPPPAPAHQLQRHQLQHQHQHQKHQRRKLLNVSLKRRLWNRRSKFIFYKYKSTYYHCYEQY